MWGAMGVVVGTPEIAAAVGGDSFPWPTISSTIGHLEARWPVVAVIPVAAIVIGAAGVIRFKPGTLVLQADQKALVRAPDGRLVRIDPSHGDLETPPADVTAGRPEFSMLGYFAVAGAAVAIGAALASRDDNKWLLGYVLYSLILLFWIVIPSIQAKRRSGRRVPFTTLFITLQCLGRRVHAVTFALAAGLGILLIHLALYPWPDFNREPATFAGLTKPAAIDRATSALRAGHRGKLALVAETAQRGTSEGRDAWLVYFLEATGDGSYRDCIVAVTKKSTLAADGCR